MRLSHVYAWVEESIAHYKTELSSSLFPKMKKLSHSPVLGKTRAEAQVFHWCMREKFNCWICIRELETCDYTETNCYQAEHDLPGYRWVSCVDV